MSALPAIFPLTITSLPPDLANQLLANGIRLATKPNGHTEMNLIIGIPRHWNVQSGRDNQWCFFDKHGRPRATFKQGTINFLHRFTSNRYIVSEKIMAGSKWFRAQVVDQQKGGKVLATFKRRTIRAANAAADSYIQGMLYRSRRRTV